MIIDGERFKFWETVGLLVKKIDSPKVREVIINALNEGIAVNDWDEDFLRDDFIPCSHCGETALIECPECGESYCHKCADEGAITYYPCDEGYIETNGEHFNCNGTCIDLNPDKHEELGWNCGNCLNRF